MKKFRFIVMMLLAVSCVAFYSCGKEEDDVQTENGGGNNNGGNNNGGGDAETETISNFEMQDNGDVVTAQFTLTDKESKQASDVSLIFRFVDEKCVYASMTMTFENEAVAKAVYDEMMAENGSKASKAGTYQLQGNKIVYDMTEMVAGRSKQEILMFLDKVKSGEIYLFEGGNNGGGNNGGDGAGVALPMGSTNYTASSAEDISEESINYAILNLTQQNQSGYRFVLALQRLDATSAEPTINDTYVGSVVFDPATGVSSEVNLLNVAGRYANNGGSVVMTFAVQDDQSISLSYSYDGGASYFTVHFALQGGEGDGGEGDGGEGDGGEGDGGESDGGESDGGDNAPTFPQGSANYTIEGANFIPEDGINSVTLNLTQQSEYSYVFTLALQYYTPTSSEPEVNDVYIGLVTFDPATGFSTEVTLRNVLGRYASNRDGLYFSFTVRNPNVIDMSYSYNYSPEGGSLIHGLHFEN